MNAYDNHRICDTAGEEVWPAVSVIVPVYNNWQGVAECLASLGKQDYRGPFEVIVVDNGSSDPVPGFDSLGLDLKIIHEPRIGSYHARNAGLSAARFEFFAFTDSDCQPLDNWLHEGMSLLLSQTGRSVVGGQVRMNAPVFPGRDVPAHYGTICAFPQEMFIRWRRFSATANLFASRVVFEEIGPFEGRLRSGGDRQWCLRAMRQGVRIAYAPDAVVEHPPRISYADQVRVFRRTEGGMRDLYPGWRNFLLALGKRILPPVWETMMIFGDRGRVLTTRQKMLCVAYAWRMRLVRVGLRWQLHFSAEESPR